MNTFIRRFHILAIFALLMAACNLYAPGIRTEGQTPPTYSVYEDILGRNLADQAVVDFIASNDCFSADQYFLCNDAGIALWLDSVQIVDTVYLYLNNVEGFEPYRGKLPFRLKHYDIMEAVEYKLKKQGVGRAGLPDQSASPDHMHYWATYEQANMTIVYNSPYADGDATIYAIIVSN